MAINFPTSLDSFSNPVATDPMNSATVPHATQHANLNDAVEALEAKVGINNSAVTTSHDYQLRRLSTPAGMIAFTIAAVQPTGWLFHNQTVVNAASTYPALWAVVPGDWQSGSDLVIPNLNNLVLMQFSTTALGDTGGSSSVTIAEANLPPHDHGIIMVGTSDGLHYHQDASGRIAQAGESFIPGSTTNTDNGGFANTAVTLPLAPHLAVNVIIRAY